MRLGIDITKFDWPGNPASIGRRLAEIGIQHTIFILPNIHKVEPLHILGNHMIPQIANF